MSESGAYGDRFGEKFGLKTAPVVVTRLLRKSELAVTEIRCDNPETQMSGAIPREDAYLVGLQLRDYPNHKYWENGRKRPEHDLRAGEMVLYDLKRDPQVLLNQPFHSLHFYLPRQTLTLIAEEDGASPIGELEYEPGKGIPDPIVAGLGHSVLAAFAAPAQASQLFVDHVTRAVAVHVGHTFGRLKPVVFQGGLAPWQKRRALELLAANLDGEIPLKDIAAACSLSVSHFSRAFRRTMGMPPHNWILRQRVDAAQGMLRGRERSLSEIALACGFADQSHFTRVFTRMVGVSPGSWRRMADD
jgi:AraC-like DNA-binding protein